jgi:hypothetical protein
MEGNTCTGVMAKQGHSLDSLPLWGLKGACGYILLTGNEPLDRWVKTDKSAGVLQWDPQI